MTDDFTPPAELQLQVLFEELTQANDQRLFLKAQNQYLIARVQELELAVASLKSPSSRSPQGPQADPQAATAPGDA